MKTSRSPLRIIALVLFFGLCFFPAVLSAQTEQKAILFPTTDTAVADKWFYSVSEQGPRLYPVSRIYKGQELRLYLIMMDYEKDGNGDVQLDYDLTVYGPSGSFVPLMYKDVAVSNGPAPGDRQLILAQQAVKLQFNDDDPVGQYTCRATVTDHVSGEVFTTETAIILRDLPPIRNLDQMSDAEISAYLESYSLNPEPVTAVATFSYFFNSDLTDRENLIPPMLGFYEGVFRSNRYLLPAMVRKYQASSGQTRYYFLYLFFLLGDDGPRDFMLNLNSNERQMMQQIAARVRPSADLLQTSMDLDYAWGMFFATGERKFLLNLLDVLTLRNRESLVYQAAQWSMSNNYRNQPLVKEYIDWLYFYDPHYSAVIEEHLLSSITD